MDRVEDEGEHQPAGERLVPRSGAGDEAGVRLVDGVEDEHPAARARVLAEDERAFRLDGADDEAVVCRRCPGQDVADLDVLKLGDDPIRAGNAVATARGGLNLARGTAEAFSILGRYKPDVVFATGGYGSVGVGLATRTRRRPLLLFLPDVEAGLAVRTLAKVADRIAVTVPPAQEMLGYDKTVLTGYPVRPQFFGVDKQAARQKLGLDPDLPTLLVSGASSGAARLNHAVSSWAADFLKIGQLVHLSGRADEANWAAEIMAPVRALFDPTIDRIRYKAASATERAATTMA